MGRTRRTPEQLKRDRENDKLLTANLFAYEDELEELDLPDIILKEPEPVTK
jgi:hypothetical protein